VGALRTLGICKISNTNMLISMLKRATPYPIHVLPCWTAVVGHSSLSKLYVHC